LHNSQYMDLNWAELERVKKVEFMSNYKQKLFDYLDKNTV